MRDIRQIDSGAVSVSPSVLAADFGNLAEETAAVERAGADVLHLDVMDGALVPNISFGVPVIASLRKHSRMLFDTHLMISRPARYAAAFAAAGADHLTFHLESDDRPEDAVQAIRDCGCTVGISLKPATPAESVFPWLDKVDLVLVMTVEPGFGGQKFMADQMEKLAAIRREISRRGLPVHLEVDGGIDAATAPVTVEHGGNMLVSGTGVFRNPAGIDAAVAALHALSPRLNAAVF